MMMMVDSSLEKISGKITVLVAVETYRRNEGQSQLCPPLDCPTQIKSFNT